MATADTIHELNRQLACRINEEAKRDPHSPFAGKFVGIANGQVVAVTDDLNELVRQLHQVEADPRKTFCLEASRDYESVEEIWSGK